ncbi:hypothetical protein B0H66DRAFT_487633 [Apodospora peruviana]|uniref:Protein NO VEIN C-terminal domain-containing protein n=1 Tax=Apodospora peruviana TaxID=516989 RepID=A0AAE0MGL6_9PEZI|nr:hypothetical protein B0H66DRAFT_487633 [Apodospora peruviana]
MASKDEAKEAVLSIAKRFGFVGDDIMDQIEQWNPSIRRIIEEGMLAKDKLAAHSITTLAKNIYGSDARFVFELLQNADDNRFTRARANCDLPFVSFQVYSDRITVECNEDGFTKEDLLAICSVGESTKSGSHGYIGAKGIGFKSVFIAAWKVYIQSGNFSFYFKHEKGDTGLGMVLPVWKDADEDMPGPLTRTTLYLHEKGHPNQLRHLREVIFKQLNDLEETCLLFLRNLKRIRVAFYDEDDELTTSKDFCVGDFGSHGVFLETTSTDEDGETTVEEKHYHVTRHTATNLSPSDNRELPDTEEGRRASSSAEVVLAFPLTEDAEPLCEKQQVYAFLPVRQTNFMFLIQSDFDTSASRQDVLTTSRRNIDLLNGIAAAFIKAILQFCEHPDLCYTWPEFLPPPDDEPSPFWTGLVQSIKDLISRTPILKARHRGDLRKISDLLWLTPDSSDRNRDPLLDDPRKDPFLAKKYSRSVVDALKEYGLKNTHFNLWIGLLEADLRSATSRMKSPLTDEDWHSRVARLFCKPFNENWECMSRIKRLAMLPLRTGRWVSADSGSVYLPTTCGIPIPTEVQMDVLDPVAVANSDRKALFTMLGATEPSVVDVRSSILASYGSSVVHVGLAESRDHLYYLYFTHQSKHNRTELKRLHIYNQDEDWGSPHEEDFYLPSDHPYGPEALLGPEDNYPPGLDVQYVHPTYLDDAPSPPTSTHSSWNKWLRDVVGVRDRLRLISRRGDSLSKTWNYVAKHRPEKLLGLLEYLWKFEGTQVSNNAALKKKIKDTDVSEICGRPVTLGNSWLPLSHLQRQCAYYYIEEDASDLFPFLDIGEEDSTDEKLITKWMFLHTNFGVGKDDDSTFLIKVLYHMILPGSTSHFERLVDLYLAIDAKCQGAVDRPAERQRVKETLENFASIYAPGVGSWLEQGECLWDAPPDMSTCTSLKAAYTHAEGLADDQMSLVSHFFQQTLGIRDAGMDDLVSELIELEANEEEDIDRILGVYKYLSSMKIIAFRDDLKKHFEQRSLIFVTKNGEPGWYKTPECLWSSTTEIQGKVTLNDHYEDLKDFFVNTLGVRTLTLQMVYDELLQTNSSRSTVDEVKNLLWSFNALLQTEPDRLLDPQPLLNASVFPVRYPGDGGTSLRSPDTVEFAIVDREHLAARFRDKIKMLDYSLEDVRRLKPFLEWAKLEHRYLSASVREITSLSGGEDTTRPITSPNRDLKRKAYGLLRIAATFNSPRYQSDAQGLYQLLRTARVLETNGISSILRVSQDGHTVDVHVSSADMHISEGSGLTVYVPMNKTAQEFCFGSPLPVNLADWLMRHPTTQIRDTVDSTAVTAITMLLAMDVSVVDRILDHQGIIQIPITNEDDTGGELDEQAESEALPTRPTSRASLTLIATRETTTGAVTPTSSDYEPDGSNDMVVTSRRSNNMAAIGSTYRPSMPRPFYSSPAAVPVQRGPSAEEDAQYRALLNRVVTAARSATFPSEGAFDMSNLLDVLPTADDINFDGYPAARFRSSSQLERDKKIGAAGELYIFELLSNLDPPLPGFNRDNWQSTIRYYAALHEDYGDMQPWVGRETADITYLDTEGELTNMLAENNYLAVGWCGKKPKYYIEVKTTTGPCETPFYMSRGQYQRMRNVHGESEEYSEVYIILRVFGIEGSQPGMCVYLDPEQLRLDGGLVFTGETWSVVPGIGSSS